MRQLHYYRCCCKKRACCVFRWWVYCASVRQSVESKCKGVHLIQHYWVPPPFSQYADSMLQHLQFSTQKCSVCSNICQYSSPKLWSISSLKTKCTCSSMCCRNIAIVLWAQSLHILPDLYKPLSVFEDRIPGRSGHVPYQGGISRRRQYASTYSFYSKRRLRRQHISRYIFCDLWVIHTIAVLCYFMRNCRSSFTIIRPKYVQVFGNTLRDCTLIAFRIGVEPCKKLGRADLPLRPPLLFRRLPFKTGI